MYSTPQSRLSKVNRARWSGSSISPTSSSCSSSSGSPEFTTIGLDSTPSSSYEEDEYNSKLKPSKKSTTLRGRKRGKRRRKRVCDSITIFFCTVTALMVGAMALMVCSMRGDGSDLSNWTHKEPGDLINSNANANANGPRFDYAHSKAEMLRQLRSVKNQISEKMSDKLDQLDVHDVGEKIARVEEMSVKAAKNNLNEVRKRLVRNQRLRKRQKHEEQEQDEEQKHGLEEKEKEHREVEESVNTHGEKNENGNETGDLITPKKYVRDG